MSNGPHDSSYPTDEDLQFNLPSHTHEQKLGGRPGAYGEEEQVLNEGAVQRTLVDQRNTVAESVEELALPSIPDEDLQRRLPSYTHSEKLGGQGAD